VPSSYWLTVVCCCTGEIPNYASSRDGRIRRAYPQPSVQWCHSSVYFRTTRQGQHTRRWQSPVTLLRDIVNVTFEIVRGFVNLLIVLSWYTKIRAGFRGHGMLCHLMVNNDYQRHDTWTWLTLSADLVAHASRRRSLFPPEPNNHGVAEVALTVTSAVSLAASCHDSCQCRPVIVVPRRRVGGSCSGKAAVRTGEQNRCPTACCWNRND